MLHACCLVTNKHGKSGQGESIFSPPGCRDLNWNCLELAASDCTSEALKTRLPSAA